MNFIRPVKFLENGSAVFVVVQEPSVGDLMFDMQNACEEIRSGWTLMSEAQGIRHIYRVCTEIGESIDG